VAKRFVENVLNVVQDAIKISVQAIWLQAMFVKLARIKSQLQELGYLGSLLFIV
jgi:predicted CoA-binding protein